MINSLHDQIEASVERWFGPANARHVSAVTAGVATAEILTLVRAHYADAEEPHVSVMSAGADPYADQDEFARVGYANGYARGRARGEAEREELLQMAKLEHEQATNSAARLRHADQQAQKHEYDLAKARARIAELEAEKEELRRQLDDAREELLVATKAENKARARIADLERIVADEHAAATGLHLELAKANERIAELEAELSRAVACDGRAMAAESRADAAEAKLAQLAETRSFAQVALDDLAERVTGKADPESMARALERGKEAEAKLEAVGEALVVFLSHGWYGRRSLRVKGLRAAQHDGTPAGIIAALLEASGKAE